VRPALAFTPGASPLHRAPLGATLGFIGAFVFVAFAYSNPLVLLAAGAAVVLAGVAAGARRAIGAGLRLAGPLLLVMMAVNALVYHRGDTILLRGWELPVLGDTSVTLESLAAGASIGLKVTVAVLAFAVYSACVDPDRVLRALRPLAQRSVLTAALAVRMVPVALADAGRIREAAELRGPAAEPVGRPALARRLVEGSLDRTIDVAATLELRGHSLGIRPVRGRERMTPAPRLWFAAAAIAAAAIAGLAVGAGGFEWYPRIRVALDAPTLALCALLPPLALLPFLGEQAVTEQHG
jgi:energy-coupling factor transporter transmembrane protein EcfT